MLDRLFRQPSKAKQIKANISKYHNRMLFSLDNRGVNLEGSLHIAMPCIPATHGQAVIKSLQN